MMTKRDRQAIYALAGSLDAIAVEMKRANELTRDHYTIDGKNSETSARIAAVYEQLTEMCRPVLSAGSEMLSKTVGLMDEYSDED